MRDPAELARPAASAPAREGFWSNVREALRGSEQDYTRGSIGRAIFLLAIPMVLEMAMESIFAVTDVFFVGRLGPDAVATIGLTESMLTLVYALAMGLGIGTTAVVARRVGEKERDGAANAAVQATVLGIAGAVLLGGLGVTFAPHLLALMGASPAVLQVGSGYTRVMLGGEATIVVLFVVNAVFRGAGDPAIAMRVLWLANAINIVLGPCFIFGLGPFPELGVTGAAVATTIGRGTGALYAISRLLRPGSRIAVQRWHLRFDMPVMRTVARLSGSGALQSIIGMASWIGLVRIVAAGFAFYAYGMVLSQSFNGAGDTFTPTMLNLIVFWLWEIPLAWALAMALGMGPRGAFVAVAVAFSTLAVVAGAIFRRGRWKRTAV